MARASPTMIRLGYSDCASCHISPQGGGMLPRLTAKASTRRRVCAGRRSIRSTPLRRGCSTTSASSPPRSSPRCSRTDRDITSDDVPAARPHVVADAAAQSSQRRIRPRDAGLEQRVERHDGGQYCRLQVAVPIPAERQLRVAIGRDECLAASGYPIRWRSSATATTLAIRHTRRR